MKKHETIESDLADKRKHGNRDGITKDFVDFSTLNDTLYVDTLGSNISCHKKLAFRKATFGTGERGTTSLMPYCVHRSSIKKPLSAITTEPSFRRRSTLVTSVRTRSLIRVSLRDENDFPGRIGTYQKLDSV
jgi:hypothetical protein